MVQVSESGTLNAVVTDVPSNQDLNLEIFIIENNGQPKRIADDDDNDAISGQNLTAVAYVDPGTYYIHIEDENNNRTNEETYNFCLSFTPNAFEVNQTIELAAAIPRDTCFEDNIWGENENFFNSNVGDDDQDWFVVQVDTACLLKVGLTNVPENLDLNLEIYQIVNGQPTIVADDGDINSNGGQALSAELDAQPGTYYIHVEDENNNRTSEEPYTFCISCEVLVKTIAVTKPEVSIYPNPTAGIITISGISPSARFRLSDLSGKTLIHSQPANREIDLTGLEPGLYFISFFDGQRVISGKIVRK